MVLGEYFHNTKLLSVLLCRYSQKFAHVLNTYLCVLKSHGESIHVGHVLAHFLLLPRNQLLGMGLCWLLYLLSTLLQIRACWCCYR